ncbi:hypothetical protein EJB05_11010, partial [Eragrostis curvula]
MCADSQLASFRVHSLLHPLLHHVFSPVPTKVRAMAKGELSMDFLSNTQTAKATLISELNLSMACSSSAKQLERQHQWPTYISSYKSLNDYLDCGKTSCDVQGGLVYQLKNA